MFFDSHAHLTCDELALDVHEIVQRANEAKVKGMVNICTDAKSLHFGLKLAEHYPCVWNAGATTPHDVDAEGEEMFDKFERAARTGMLIAVGETGLDYHYAHSKKETQQDFLKRYFALALDVRLPVIIHCRDAFEDLFAIADSHYAQKAPLILHCFTGTLDEAKEVVRRGWYVSLSGIVTFKKSQALRDVAKEVPLNQLLIETDAPYLAPTPFRGKTNEPAFLPHTAECIANVRGITVQELAKATARNAIDVFKVAIPK